MLTIAILGIFSTIMTEVITWLNKRLTGTLLQGDGAFILSILVSIVAASYIVLANSTVSITWQNFSVIVSAIWATSQVVFTFVVQKLNLTVQPTVQQ